MEDVCIDKVNRLADEIGQFIQYWGFKSIHGKIWTHIYLAQQPIDAAEIMSRLKISKSLVSITISDLLQYKVILQSGKSSRDTIVYTANPMVKDVILEVLKQRELKMMERLQSSYSEAFLDCEQKSSQLVKIEKLKLLGEMIGVASTTLQAIVSLKAIDFGSIKL